MRTRTQPILAILATVLLTATGVGQDTLDIDALEPFGAVERTTEAYDAQDVGAIVLTHTTPTDQNANFDVVGPDDYRRHFDFADEPGEGRLLGDLQPGVYSVAATDEGLDLIHTVVEVRAGESTHVHADLEVWQEGAFVPGAYDPATSYGRRDAEAVPAYPAGSFRLRQPTPFTVQRGFGAIAVDARDATIDTVVTGPNGYYVELEGNAVTDALWPGVYAIASTEEGFDLAVTTVEVEEGSRLEITPSLVRTGSASSDGDAGADGEASGGSTEDESSDAEDAAAASGQVSVRTDEDLGRHLVDGEGRTLYMFVAEGANPGTAEPMTEGVRDAAAACTDAEGCLPAWPPFTSDGDGPLEAGSGVDPELLYTADVDGRSQVVYDGWPLFHFADDREPGQAAGHDSEAFGGTWYAVAPDGTPASAGDGGGD